MADLLARANALVPLLRERAAEAERRRSIHPDSMARCADAELFRLMQPARYGGFEYGFAELLDVSTAIGRGDTSAAWCAGLVIVHNWMLALFPAEAQDDVWGPNPGARIAGSYAPQARAEAVPGGYRVAGRWAFTSGCDHADWLFLGVFMLDDPAKPTPGFLVVPRDSVELLDDWEVLGLAATGSKTVEIREPLFVPGHRRLTFAEASSQAAPGTAVNPASIYRVPFLANVPVVIAAPPLGGVQGAYEVFLEFVANRTTRGAVAGAGNAMRELAQVQTRVAEAAASLDAARLLLRRDAVEIEEAVARGEPVTVDQRIRNRRDHAYAVKLTTQAANALFEAVGGVGLSLGNAVQRAWRDAHAAQRHISLNWDAVSTMYGQSQLGLEPRGQY